MEVHHHSSDTGSHAGKAGKRFKHYLFEFLMLFLAVFCGFLAENFREHQVEHRRENVYMHSLVEDLQTDTSNLIHIVKFGQIVSSRIQALVDFINNDSAKINVQRLYELSIQSGRVVNINFEDRTSSQLKNAGEMRLIRNKKVADSIRNYWSIIKVMDDIKNRLESLGHDATEVSVKLFNNKYHKFMDMNDPLRSAVSILPGAKLINDDPKLLAEYSNWKQNRILVLNNYIRYMNIAKDMATNLILLIKKEYP